MEDITINLLRAILVIVAISWLNCAKKLNLYYTYMYI